MNMVTTHKTTFVGKCPMGCDDIYEAVFTVIGTQVLWVEDIQKALNQLTAEETTQESLTEKLCQQLKCTVTTRCTHSRFETECTATFE